MRLDLWGGTSGTFDGFDRFGPVVDHLWRDDGGSADADRSKYGYDRAGNRAWKENDVAAKLGTPVHLDELYDYDDVYRLINAERGNLNANHDAICVSASLASKAAGSGCRSYSTSWRAECRLKK